ncbi:hypothetical protein M8998_13260 [Sphingobacterium sp. lm-10]|uniref:hypothetical protein n=1 Tax=Sphingobacterium sp. lm-10 TaxID=2944904 RepID=UPI00201FDF14|nr:hypothetical protein [Sphingobacterium sp. lm-10]MCL7988913.1 hypothetical protein [Sphingobacterium sp. lm-10]
MKKFLMCVLFLSTFGILAKANVNHHPVVYEKINRSIELTDNMRIAETAEGVSRTLAADWCYIGRYDVYLDGEYIGEYDVFIEC